MKKSPPIFINNNTRRHHGKRKRIKEWSRKGQGDGERVRQGRYEDRPTERNGPTLQGRNLRKEEMRWKLYARQRQSDKRCAKGAGLPRMELEYLIRVILNRKGIVNRRAF